MRSDGVLSQDEFPQLYLDYFQSEAYLTSRDTSDLESVRMSGVLAVGWRS